MPTTKKRINLSVDDELYKDLMALKKQKKSSSVSAVVIDLAREALELNEDIYFGKIAEERKHDKMVPYENVRKNFKWIGK